MRKTLLPTAQIALWVLRQERRSIAVWGLATAVVAGFYAAFWGLFTDLDELTALIDSLPAGFAAAMGYDQIGTAVGYLDSTVFSLLAPMLLSVFAVVFSGRVLTGAEERGDLELEFAAPVSRMRILGERTVAAIIALAAAAFTVGLVLAVIVTAIAMDVAIGNLIAATFGLFLYSVAIALVTIAVGAFSGRRPLALGVGAGVAVGGFVLNAVAPLVEQASWLTWFSPFAWYTGADALRNGISFGAYGGLALLGAAAFVLGSRQYIRRDLGV